MIVSRPPSRSLEKEFIKQVVYKQRCGLDVYQKIVVACVTMPKGKESRTFGTMTQDLLELSDWLISCGVTHVAMESTGVLWKPVYNLLEGLGLTLPVVNAHHIKSVPGRKTDIKDAEWIAKLLQHGLLRCSYIPDRPNRELCELVRYRRSLIQQRAQAVNRIQKVLEGANIKLSSVASDITGVSGRAMLEAISSGQDDPDRLVLLAKGRLQSKRVELKQALRGLTGPPQRLLIQSLLRQLDFLANEVTSFALAHTILVMIYYMLVRGTSYQELGGNYFDERNEQAAIKRAVNRIEQLGYKVTLELAAS